MEIYGRRISEDSRYSKHLYLPGEHQGVWNRPAFTGKELIICESIVDALSFWMYGFENVTASYGTQGWTREYQDLLLERKIEKVWISYDRDEAGEIAARKLLEKLSPCQVQCYRLLSPVKDINEWICKSENPKAELQRALHQAHWMEPPLNQAIFSLASPITPDTPEPEKSFSLSLEQRGNDFHITFGDRNWRIRGFHKNMSLESLRINLRISCQECFFLDALDLYQAKARKIFLYNVAQETGIKEDVLKKDLGKILLELEQRQEQEIRDYLEPGKPEITLSGEETSEAMQFLQDPKLIERIVQDFEDCGLTGERTNSLLGYLSCVSRKMSKPLAIIIQSSSSAGKSTLMEAMLQFMPEEDICRYTAMTGQSLFYLGENALVHKILAISEEEGADKAQYALKTLQSEGKIRIASTGKDIKTGRLETQPYETNGPVAIMMTTTNVEIDEELQNRCLILSINESRQQTLCIQKKQREMETLEGRVLQEKQKIKIKVHQNAQRLLQPWEVLNPYASELNFPSHLLRLRRDHSKYLGLIKAVTLLHQFQRNKKQLEVGGQVLEYLEVDLSDIQVANRLMNEILRLSLDELAPQTRKLLADITEMVETMAKEKEMDPGDVRFTRKEIREASGWNHTRLKKHLNRLEDMEYLALHQGRKGKTMVYELLYGLDEKETPFILKLTTPSEIKQEP